MAEEKPTITASEIIVNKHNDYELC